MFIVCYIVIAVILPLAFFSLKNGSHYDTHTEVPKKQPEPVKTIYRYAHQIALTYGPLSIVEAGELAWPTKQFISVKKNNDKYARWAKIEEINDGQIRYIGSAEDCWLSMDEADVSGVRPYHLGIVKSRGSFFVFELDAKRKAYGLNYDWWNHPYSNLTDSEKFEVGNISLVFYRSKKPVTIEGKNTNGIE